MRFPRRPAPAPPSDIKRKPTGRRFALGVRKAQAALGCAAKVKSSYLPALDGYCRFLATSNRFIERVVAWPVFLAALQRLLRSEIETGLPER